MHLSTRQSHGLLKVSIGCGLGALLSTQFTLPVWGQSLIVPDDTLGGEQSQVIQNFNGTPNEVIVGGAQRAQNLFHSFEEFNVDEGRGAFFFSPDNVSNIFSRVTGNNPSNILGTLGTLGVDEAGFLTIGNANLFLINPNGIVFSENASLSVGGSFAATTADAIQFADAGFFSATNPEAPSELLTIDPSAFLFSQIPSGNIDIGLNVGLQVPNGENLSLLGGDIAINRSGLAAFGGRVDIGAVGGMGTVGLNPDGSLSFPENLERADVELTDGSVVDVMLDNDGHIAIHAQNISLRNSDLLAGIIDASSDASSQAGDIVLNASGEIQITELSDVSNTISANTFGTAGNIDITAEILKILGDALVTTSTLGEGHAGNITINVRDRITLDSSNIFSRVSAGAIGEGGDINIITSNLEILNGSLFLVGTFTGTEGNAGSITIRTNILTAQNDSRLIADSFGEGDSGDVTIHASGSIVFDNAVISSSVAPGISRNGGTIDIVAGALDVINAARFITGTFGDGNAGNITLDVSDQITIDNSFILTLLVDEAEGNAGDISISTNILNILNGSQLSTSTGGKGNAGDIIIQVDDRIILAGVGSVSELPSTILAIVARDAEGSGGTVNITTSRLEIRDGATLSATTQGRGNAGDITITASDRILLANSSDSGSPSSILTDTTDTATGRAGSILINSPDLRLVDGAVINARTRNSKLGGSITVNADRIDLIDGGQLVTTSFSDGDAGNIILTAEQISMEGRDLTFLERSETLGDEVLNEGTGQSGLFANTRPDFGGNGGRIRVNATNLTLQDEATISTQTEGTGNGGAIVLNVLGNLEMSDRAQITSSTSGQGDAGDIRLRVADSITLSNSSISSEVGEGANGEGGDITIQAGQMTLGDRSLISAQSLSDPDEPVSATLRVTATGNNPSNAGDILIVIDDVLIIDNSDITTQAEAFAGGAIAIQAGTIRLFGDGDIQTSVQSGEEGGGNITLTADSIIAFDDSDILAFAADGRGGDVTLDTPAFFGENFDPVASATDPPDTLDGNDRVDINASGAVAGVITLPDVSFIPNSLNDLPEGVINTESLIANSCVVRNEDGSSTFIITGAGGLPDRPGDAETSVYPTGDVQAIPDDSSDADSGWQMGDPIVEPQSVYQLPNGELILSHACR